jgi:hypothetical protein
MGTILSPPESPRDHLIERGGVRLQASEEVHPDVVVEGSVAGPERGRTAPSGAGLDEVLDSLLRDAHPLGQLGGILLEQTA